MNEASALSLCLQTPGCLPPFLLGKPGSGKTSVMGQMAAGFNWIFELLRPGERGEGAFGVVPVPSEDRRLLHYPMPDWAHAMIADGRDGLILIDEATSIPPALQPAVRGLALDGIIGSHKLPLRIRRCAAGTPVDQAAGGWDMAPDLANRWVYLEWPDPKADQWCAWLSGQSDATGGVRLDLNEWEVQWGQAKALGMAFIRSHPSALSEDIDKISGRSPMAYATPRTWECALRLLAACRASARMDFYPLLAQGSIGPAVALEGNGDAAGAWLVWLRDNDLPDPEDLLKDPGQFEHDPKRPDRTFATLLAVAEAGLATVNGKKLSDKARAERWEAAWAIMDRGLGMKIGKDTVLLPCKVLVDRQRRPNLKVWGSGPCAQKVSAILRDFIEELVEI